MTYQLFNTYIYTYGIYISYINKDRLFFFNSGFHFLKLAGLILAF